MIKHRSSIETWSKSGGQVFTQNGFLSYDFTTSAAQAFGNNQKLVGSKYCIYSGDVTQDGVIEASDLSAIDNASFSFASGYISTDLNGDRIADASDASICENNALNFVSKITP